ncbi:Engulfment/cell motility, ELMO [Cynara cardunculus var. scolymus]|uniref:Engulfment/cell motility, ELMO n=1 Tax=Cynara cardunculus var. scolymus TaxID=59895 RepID=A0A124SD58_CYNCS|nr:Engulfment/cell motility, ELMO [Cynara cardunculus var. scolymus]
MNPKTTPCPEGLFPRAFYSSGVGSVSPKAQMPYSAFFFFFYLLPPPQTLAPPFSPRGPHHPHLLLIFTLNGSPFLLLLRVIEFLYILLEESEIGLVWYDERLNFEATAMVGPRTWIGGIFSRTGLKRSGSNKYIDFKWTPVQEARYQRLQDRTNVPYDETCIEHQKALVELWNLAYPNVTLQGLISDQWKEMGWQGANPSTDFRGCGFLSLENLLFFAKTFPTAFRRLLFKQRGIRAQWEYPFAVAGINVSFMLTQMLELYSGLHLQSILHDERIYIQDDFLLFDEFYFAVKPRCLHCVNFVKILGEDEEAFDVLYCIAFALMDAQWLAMHASYMEFNEVLQVTRTQLERELALEDIHRIRDLPAFNLLDT